MPSDAVFARPCVFICSLLCVFQDPHAEEFEDKEWTFVIENVSPVALAGCCLRPCGGAATWWSNECSAGQKWQRLFCCVLLQVEIFLLRFSYVLSSDVKVHTVKHGTHTVFLHLSESFSGIERLALCLKACSLGARVTGGERAFLCSVHTVPR